MEPVPCGHIGRNGLRHQVGSPTKKVMPILDADMRRVVDEQRLSFVATVNRDGTPNLSPKGSTAVWDDDHLAFADIRSPQTISNLETVNPAIEINVVDPISRKGYRFRGTATVLRSGAVYDALLSFFRSRAVESEIGAIVLVRVRQSRPIVSPVYDTGASESDVRALYLERLEQQRRAH